MGKVTRRMKAVKVTKEDGTVHYMTPGSAVAVSSIMSGLTCEPTTTLFECTEDEYLTVARPVKVD